MHLATACSLPARFCCKRACDQQGGLLVQRKCSRSPASLAAPARPQRNSPSPSHVGPSYDGTYAFCICTQSGRCRRAPSSHVRCVLRLAARLHSPGAWGRDLSATASCSMQRKACLVVNTLNQGVSHSCCTTKPTKWPVHCPQGVLEVRLPATIAHIPQVRLVQALCHSSQGCG